MNGNVRYKVVKNRNSDYPEPICLKKGDTVELGRKYSEKEEWQGWIYCTKDGLGGWVPEQIIRNNEDGTGLIAEDYSALELDVTEGEIIVAVRELNGWVQGFKEKDEKLLGWIPLENLIIATL